MKRFASKSTRRILRSLVTVVFCTTIATAGVYQHGTVVRMRMGECLPAHHGFMVAFGGQATQSPVEVCPEYTLISEKVVFVIVGKSSNQLVPLADVIDFRLRNSELAVRIDDARHESRFSIKEMILRSEWDYVQKHITEQMSMIREGEENRGALQTRQ
jgi:hypothetical protein